VCERSLTGRPILLARGGLGGRERVEHRRLQLGGVLLGGETGDRCALALRLSATVTAHRSKSVWACPRLETGAVRHPERVMYLIAASTTPLRCGRRAGQTHT
jgi:hypothetical protein